MGDPKKHRAKFSGPTHPWQKDRLDQERTIRKEYGLKNKKEIWKMQSKLKNFLAQTKKLVGLDSAQAGVERQQLSNKVQRLGLLPKEAPLTDILGLSMENIMDRRLQTVVFKRGMAKSSKQARQFIVHEHVVVNRRKITSPGYIVSVDEENTIEFTPKSALANEEHPERKVEDNKPPMREAKEGDEEEGEATEEKGEEKPAAEEKEHTAESSEAKPKEEPAPQDAEEKPSTDVVEEKNKEKPSEENTKEEPKEKTTEETKE